MPSSTSLTVGVLALQGDVREHLAALTRCGVDPVAVRRPGELATVDGLVLPGGESTTMIRLARTFDLLGPLRERLAGGLPAFGTCAGMIMLAREVLDGEPHQETFGGLDITVRRNAFGSQVHSFETDLDVVGVDGPVHAVFIRAPWVEEAGEGVEILARVGASPSAGAAAGRIVAVRQGPLLATSFHPEVAGPRGADDRFHRLFVEMIQRAREEVVGK